MLKRNELSDESSCLNRALDVEMLFVLIARDVCAPDTVRYWCGQRVLRGKNKASDRQIVEAMECARRMEEQQRVLKEQIDEARKQEVARIHQQARRHTGLRTASNGKRLLRSAGRNATRKR